MADLIRAGNHKMVAKVARSVASDADRRAIEKPCHRKVKPVVGIYVRIGWQRIRHAKEITVAGHRIRVDFVVESVIIPVVGVDAAIRGFHLVGTSDEIAIGSENDLRVDGEVCVAAEEKVFPCENAATIVAVKPPQSALAWNGRHWNANSADFVRGITRSWADASIDEIPE